MELRNTIEDMLSNDYKKRFKAESAVQFLEMIYNAVVRG